MVVVNAPEPVVFPVPEPPCVAVDDVPGAAPDDTGLFGSTGIAPVSTFPVDELTGYQTPAASPILGATVPPTGAGPIFVPFTSIYQPPLPSGWYVP